ncbi:MAG: DUF2304 domain-containing protein [Anaerolineae bacterium]
MSWQLQFVVLLGSLLLLMTILELMRRRRLGAEYALLWLLTALLILFLVLFKDLTDVLAQRLGIAQAPSLLTVVAVTLLILNQLVLSVVISSFVQKNRDLAQKVAVLEWHTNQLRKRAQEQERQESTVWPRAMAEDQLVMGEEVTTPP